MSNQGGSGSMFSSICQGIRVLELTEALAGPSCAMMLGDFGADVIKIERRIDGDQTRAWGPPYLNGQSCYFLMANRNKRSLALDYHTPKGLEILHRLIAGTDVILVNTPRMSTLAKYGIDPDTLCKRYPRLVFCAISGYGHTGPRAGTPGYDIIVQAEAGAWSITGEPDGDPVRYPVPIADLGCGLYSTIGVLSALLGREKSGRGQFIDIGLFDSQLTWLTNIGSNFLNAGQKPKRYGNAHPNIIPYNQYKGSDGKDFIVGVGTPAQWTRFMSVLGTEQTLGADPRFATNTLRVQHRNELEAALREIFARCSIEVWLRKLGEAQIPAAPVQSVEEVLTDPRVLARGLVAEMEHPKTGKVRNIANPVRLSATPVQYRLAPPLHGEHTMAILEELGYSQEEIAAAQRDAAI